MAAALAPDAQTTTQTPERSVSPAVHGKRKREPENESEKPAEKTAVEQDELYLLLDDLVLLLKSDYPFTLDVLSRSIASAANSDPSSKRAKLSSPPTEVDATVTTIGKQIESKSYENFEDIVSDFDAAINDYLRENEASQSGANGSRAMPGTRTETEQQARALRADIHDMIGSEKQRRARAVLTPVSGNGVSSSAATTTATTKNKGGQGLQLSNQHAIGQDVLTVFGADYRFKDGGRQWYASRKDPPTDTPDELDPIASAILPSAVSVTSIKSMGRPVNRKAKKPSTLGDLIPAPSPSHALKPPQPPTSGVTRSQVVEWHKPSSEPQSRRPFDKDSYTFSRLPRGSWLEYSSRADAEESTAEKRLKRDRTLSGGGEGPDPAELEFLQQSSLSRARAKKASLFRSVFSSFAPSHDDSHAIVPAQTRSEMWWERTGKELYQQYSYPHEELSLEEKLRALDPQLRDDPPSEEEVKALEAAVDEYVAAPEDEFDAGNGETETDDLLRDISENIENLIIYQQERLKTVSASAKSTSTQTPSPAEEELYELMKMQLMSIVSTLPPAAVSRLDGDKLKKLNVSTAIPISVPSYSGIMDLSDKTPAPRPLPSASAGISGRVSYPQPVGTPQGQRVPPQQPRSAYATGSSAPMARPAMPQQYSVQQPGRYANQYGKQQQGQASPLPNGYGQPPRPYQMGSPGPNNTPTRHPNQYSARPPPPYQPRPTGYQGANNSNNSTGSGSSAQASPAQTAAGRQGSPQRPGSYSLGQTRSPYTVNQGQQGTPQQPQPQQQQQQQQMSAGHAASVYRPPSSGSSIPQGASGTIGAFIDLSPEEQQAIAAKQQQQQRGSGSPHVSPHKPLPQNKASSSTPKVSTPTINGNGRGSPAKQAVHSQGAGTVNGV